MTIEVIHPAGIETTISDIEYTYSPAEYWGRDLLNSESVEIHSLQFEGQKISDLPEWLEIQAEQIALEMEAAA